MKIYVLFFVIALTLLPIANATADGDHGMSDEELAAVTNCLITVGCCSDHVPLIFLGYKGGHKHNFCRSVGFDTYQPNTSECIKNCNNAKIETKTIKCIGYKKGHKNNYCRKYGYEGYMPAPNGDKSPSGYCYKNK